MNYKFKIAIAIPTYNRAEILMENIEAMLPELFAHNVPIYISDDSNNTDTAEAIKKISYPNIFYTSNNPSYGHDKNCISTLKLADAEYIWYLGDSIYIAPGKIADIIKYIDTHAPDLICVNAPHRVLNTQTCILNDKKKFLIENSWHLTLTGSSIYRKSSICLSNLDIEKWKNFPQTGIALSTALIKHSKVIWIGEETIKTNPKKNSYWSKNVIDVFARDWCNFIQSFSQHFTKEEQQKLEISHSAHTKILSAKALVIYRSQNYYNYKIFYRYQTFLIRSSQCKVTWLFFISVTPKIICKAIVKTYNLLKKQQNTCKIN